MTVSDPGAGQQQGREVCGWRREGVPTMACILTPNHGTLMPHALGVPAPSPTPPARDSGRTLDGYGRNIGACTECHTAPNECTGPDFCCEDCLHLDEGWEGYETSPAESSGRDEAREAVARWLGPHVGDNDEPRLNAYADELLALPELDKLLRRPA